LYVGHKKSFILIRFIGNCSVSPLSGVALSTIFTFRCDKWTDPESPLVYEFSYGGNQSWTMFSYRIIPSGIDISVTDWLVAGGESNNYTLTVQFTVKDDIGSKAVQYVDVQVAIFLLHVHVFCYIGL
jgi:hypothetical protein